MNLRHELFSNDLLHRRNFCIWLLRKSIRIENKLIINDKAAYILREKLNNHNDRHYAPRITAPELNFDVEISRGRVSVWIGLCESGAVIGPIYASKAI